MVVSVVFNGKLDSKEYHYQMDNNNVKLWDKVLVPVGEYGHIETATVVAMWLHEVYYKYNPARYLKHVIAIADRRVLVEQMEKEIEQIEEKYEKLLSKLQ